MSTGTDLVRPGDITDAIDSRDLLDTVLAKNLSVIEKKIDMRKRNEWVAQEKKKIRDTYTRRAADAYDKMWATCGKSSVGHNFRRLDVGGYSMNQCDDCRYVAPVSPGVNGHTEERKAKVMNDDMIKSMADRMIEVDVDANLLTWPTVDDYMGNWAATPIEKKKGWFR